MKKILLFLFLTGAQASFGQKVQTPDQIYGELFVDVQMSHIFPDNKTFVDCIPKRDPKAIVRDYLKVKNNPAIRFSLQKFVEENFDIPKAPQLNYVTKEKDVVMHIKNLWGVLKREKDVAVPGSSLLPLPNPYIVPGGRFREIYYWDSFFTMLGLKESSEYDMMENMVSNFAYLINTYGHIPNGNRSYYITRSQPPFFSLMVGLLAEVKGDDIYKTFLPALMKEHAFWMEGAGKLKPGQAYRRVVKLNDGTILNRYWDDSSSPRQEGYSEDVAVADKIVKNFVMVAPKVKDAIQEKRAIDFQRLQAYRNLRAGAESGIDFSSRWFGDEKNITSIQVTDIIPVDLNSLLYQLEMTISKALMKQKNTAASNEFLKKANSRFRAVEKYCYNERLNYYTDYNFVKREKNKIITPAGMYPFCFFNRYPEGMQTLGEKAAGVIKEHLLKPGGIVTTVNNTGQQWDAPNGWAPLEWMVIWGLDRSGQKDLAKDIAYRWVKLNIKVFENTGKLMEKYNVVDTNLDAGGGEYPSQDGFGWTNGVLLALMKKYDLHQ